MIKGQERQRKNLANLAYYLMRILGSLGSLGSQTLFQIQSSLVLSLQFEG